MANKGDDMLNTLDAQLKAKMGDESGTSNPAVREEINKTKQVTSKGGDLLAGAEADGGIVAHKDDMLSSFAGTGSEPTPEPKKAAPAPKSTEVDESSEDDPYANWSKEQVIDAMKKARSEAAKNRVENKAIQEQFQTQLEEEMAKVKEFIKPLEKKAKAYEKLQQEEEDRQRSMEEKIAHRERIVAEREAELELLREKLQQIEVESKEKIDILSSRVEAHESYYKEQLDKELEAVPNEYRTIAEAVVSGTDPKEALSLLRDAKNKGMFGPKKVYVNNSVPTAHTGARTDSAAVENTRRENMSPAEKIREGLKQLGSKKNNNFGF